MPTIGQGSPPVREKPILERSLTIMVMGKRGKVRSFQLSRSLLFLAALFFVAYLPFSAYLVNRHFELSQTNKSQQAQIERLEKDLSRSTNAFARSREHILFLEDYVFQMENRAERASQPNTLQAKKLDGLAGQPVDAKTDGKETAATVSIEEVVLQKQRGILEVNFKIVNLLPGETSVGGYVHMTAKGEGGPGRLEWSYPQVKRIDGFPENYRRGQLFLIQRFKPIQGRLSVGSGTDAPTVLEILIYDKGGRIVLQKDFKIP